MRCRDLAAVATSPDLKRAFDEHLRANGGAPRAPGADPEGAERRSPAAITAREWRASSRKGGTESGGTAPSDVKDAALISAAQRVEHYEIAGYGTARTYARLLGDWESERLLQQTLDEEGATDHRLSDLATSGINQHAQTRDAPAGRAWSRLRYLDADDLDDSILNYRDLTVRNGKQRRSRLARRTASSKRPAVARTTYVVDSGGWFMGRRYLIPVGKASFEATRQALIVDMDRDTIKTYPEFSTTAFMSMSDDEVRRYERRVLHTINPNASASTTYWESYDRLPEYSQPDWLRPTARPRRAQPVGSIASPETDWRGSAGRGSNRSTTSGDWSPAPTVRTPDAESSERIVAHEPDAWMQDPRDNTRDDAGERIRDATPRPIEHEDDLAR